MNSLSRSGWKVAAVSEASPQGPAARSGAARATAESGTDGGLDYFVERDGKVFAGRHLLLDLWGAKNLDDPQAIERALRDAVAAANATLLHVHVHRFTPMGGVSGVAVLAESHISIHTWPERAFAAIDVFMCGNCDPQKSVPVLTAAFAPERLLIDEVDRGLIE